MKPESGRATQGDRSDIAPPIRVLVVEDHVMLAAAITEILSSEAGIAVHGPVRTGAAAVAATLREHPDVVLLPYRLPDMSSFVAGGMIRAAACDTAIVFHTADDSETGLLDAIVAGASAYLTRSTSSEQLIEAVRGAARGDVLIPAALFAKAIARERRGAGQAREEARLLASFTPRELEVLHLLAEGLHTTTIADRLQIADHTVEWHVRHVIEKLQVHSKLQAVVEAARKGLIEL